MNPFLALAFTVLENALSLVLLNQSRGLQLFNRFFENPVVCFCLFSLVSPVVHFFGLLLIYFLACFDICSQLLNAGGESDRFSPEEVSFSGQILNFFIFHYSLVVLVRLLAELNQLQLDPNHALYVLLLKFCSAVIDRVLLYLFKVVDVVDQRAKVLADHPSCLSVQALVVIRQRFGKFNNLLIEGVLR